MESGSKPPLYWVFEHVWNFSMELWAKVGGDGHAGWECCFYRCAPFPKATAHPVGMPGRYSQTSSTSTLNTELSFSIMQKGNQFQVISTQKQTRGTPKDLVTSSRALLPRVIQIKRLISSSSEILIYGCVTCDKQNWWNLISYDFFMSSQAAL